MNSQFSLTRRDVVSLLVYATLAYDALSSLFAYLYLLISSHIPWFFSSNSNEGSSLALISGAVSVTFALAFIPVVPLVANGVAGRTSFYPGRTKNLLSLICSCLGVMLLIREVPSIVSELCYFLTLPASSRMSSSNARQFYVQQISTGLSIVPLGLVLAFFPSIFAGMRSRVRGEENAA